MSFPYSSCSGQDPADNSLSRTTEPDRERDRERDPSNATSGFRCHITQGSSARPMAQDASTITVANQSENDHVGSINQLSNLPDIDHANLLNQQQQFRDGILGDQQRAWDSSRNQASPSTAAPTTLATSTTAAAITDSVSSSDGQSHQAQPHYDHEPQQYVSSYSPSPSSLAHSPIQHQQLTASRTVSDHTSDHSHLIFSSSDRDTHHTQSPSNLISSTPISVQSNSSSDGSNTPAYAALDKYDLHSTSDTTADIQSLSSQFNLSLACQSYNRSTSNLASTASLHSDSQSSGINCPPSSSTSISSFVHGHGHYFTKKTFHKPSYCHHCADMLWGIIGQGFICEICNFVVHERCKSMVVSCCSTVASSAIKNPTPHCWTDSHPRRKFCNVCRKRIEDNASAIRCSVCEYCAHTECKELSISDCKECATYVPDQQLLDVTQHHHWREGNLPQTSSKCYYCKKSCGSAECLTGMKCEWCLMTVHASCLKHIPAECDFGMLRSIMLPPYCVSIPRTDVPLETIIGVENAGTMQMGMSANPGSSGGTHQSLGSASGSSAGVTKRDNLSPRSTSEDFGQLASQEDSVSRDKDEETIRVYDGNSSLKRRSFRLVSVLRTVSKDQLVSACLRAFHIHDDVSHYVIIDFNDSFDRELDEPMPVLSLLRREKKAAILLRYRPPDQSKGIIKVYPGRLNLTHKITDTYCTVEVTNDTNVDEVMIQALEKFHLDPNGLNRYRLVEVSLDKGSYVHERTMDNQECPWEIIKNVARESVRQKENTRFYLKQSDEVYCSNVAIFVGNLPQNLSQKQYESILIEILGKPYRFKQMNPIYYEYGSCIITYDNADIAVKAFYRLRESSVYHGDEVRTLCVLLLPNIMPEMIPEDVRPLLVFVNVKSGGCQGLDLITSFRKLLNPYQVYDLENGGPLPGLYVFRKIKDYRILVSGGDGSVGWVLQCLDNVGQDSVCQSPPCAILPLGTGNDLARVLRWGSGYTGGEDPLSLLKDIIEAEAVILDRWTVVFHSDEATKPETPFALTTPTSSTTGAEDNASIFVMNNYFGIGVDADLCLGFHNAREENPDKFNSRLHNKSVYVKQALWKMMNKKPWKTLNKEIKLEVDGKVVPLPPLEGIIILNILSWGSGANPWGTDHDDRFVKPTHFDGMLEVVGVTGIVHMGQIQSGLCKATRIAQGGRIRIRLNTEMPVQVDGEPWIQTAGEVNIYRSALRATMLRKCKMKRRNTEPTLNQTMDRSVSTLEKVSVTGDKAISEKPDED
ncbi:Diacylglycerol kinase theta [Fragariocoptes setiger]|uniref:Diacylglycerol kinase n=1 Tax=Fragariocoptes setiger TaxID=1670756 RepID=A0ABQ7SBM9_9ACAR|nr:Diacylglycerol kinase theta [Fragariocoptes setiger]